MLFLFPYRTFLRGFFCSVFMMTTKVLCGKRVQGKIASGFGGAAKEEKECAGLPDIEVLE